MNQNRKRVEANTNLQYKINELIDDSDGPLFSLPYIEMHVSRNMMDNVDKPATIIEDNEDVELPVTENRMQPERPDRLDLIRTTSNNNFVSSTLHPTRPQDSNDTPSDVSLEKKENEEKACPICTLLCDKMAKECHMCGYNFL